METINVLTILLIILPSLCLWFGFVAGSKAEVKHLAAEPHDGVLIFDSANEKAVINVDMKLEEIMSRKFIILDVKHSEGGIVDESESTEADNHVLL